MRSSGWKPSWRDAFLRMLVLIGKFGKNLRVPIPYNAFSANLYLPNYYDFEQTIFFCFYQFEKCKTRLLDTHGESHSGYQTGVHSVVTAKMSTALWQRKRAQCCDSDGADVTALTVTALG